MDVIISWRRQWHSRPTVSPPPPPPPAAAVRVDKVERGRMRRDSKPEPSHSWQLSADFCPGTTISSSCSPHSPPTKLLLCQSNWGCGAVSKFNLHITKSKLRPLLCGSAIFNFLGHHFRSPSGAPHYNFRRGGRSTLMNCRLPWRAPHYLPCNALWGVN